MIAYALASTKGFQWNVVRQYFLSREILDGLWLTLLLTVMAMAVGIILGTTLAIMRLSKVPLLRWLASLYIYIFRGTPILVQLVFWFNLASLFPRIGIGIPFERSWAAVGTNSVISPLTAALLGLGLNQAAYTSEIVRAGILSVDRGQTEAATTLGLSSSQKMRRIVLPQAMRVIIPPVGNEVIGMLKTSALASVISLQELLQSATTIYTRLFEPIPLLMVAALWYLIVTSVLTIGQHFVERHFSHSTRSTRNRGRRWRRQPGGMARRSAARVLGQ